MENCAASVRARLPTVPWQAASCGAAPPSAAWCLHACACQLTLWGCHTAQHFPGVSPGVAPEPQMPTALILSRTWSGASCPGRGRSCSLRSLGPAHTGCCEQARRSAHRGPSTAAGGFAGAELPAAQATLRRRRPCGSLTDLAYAGRRMAGPGRPPWSTAALLAAICAWPRDALRDPVSVQPAARRLRALPSEPRMSSPRQTPRLRARWADSWWLGSRL